LGKIDVAKIVQPCILETKLARSVRNVMKVVKFVLDLGGISAKNAYMTLYNYKGIIVNANK